MNIINLVTLRTLGRNKTRTLVTIIGIILSAAMFTAVTTLVYSFQEFLVNYAIERAGDWHGVVYDINKTQLDSLNNDSEVKSHASLQNIGYALLPESQNEYKPYLFVGGMSDNFADVMPVKLISGRLPENSSEIILPDHMQTNGGIYNSIGDTLSLELGSRVIDGYVLNQRTGYVTGGNGKKEEFKVSGWRSFTVVGFYERPDFENYSSPGYTALTVADNSDEYKLDVYIKLHKPKNIYSFIEAKFPENGSSTNSDLLRFMGASDDNRYNTVLYNLAAILMVLIMFGSISLIYNAFSISLNERTKQFGLLSSIGATKRQMLRAVLFEAGFLSMIGIPIGVLAGITGIGITLRMSRNLFTSIFGKNSGVVLGLSVSWAAVAIASAIGLVTVLISAFIPARRALKVSAIDAIRQTSDIKIKARKVKTSRLTYYLFGFEGMLARKNFKRNKRKYRATVISLFLSLVLFISASSFSTYLTRSVDSVLEKADYDIIYRFSPNDREVSLQKIYDELSGVPGVTKAGYAYSQYETTEIAQELITEDYLERINKVSGEDETQSKVLKLSTTLYFIEDALYEDYLEENSLDKNIFMNTASPKAVALDFVRIYDAEDGRYYTYNLMKSKTFDVLLIKVKEIEGYHLYGTQTDDEGNKYYVYGNEKEEQIKLPAEEAEERIPLEAGTVAYNKPFCVNTLSGITLLYPYSAMEKIIGTRAGDMQTALYFKADNHKAVYDRISNILREKGLATSGLFDYADSVETNRAMITVINIFSYGFIILISLISAANVFNTISTNIALRRREFAMLKSIGLTQKGFNKMMNYECLLYGLKGLAYGIPVSFGITYLIYRSVESGWETNYFVPWYSIAIAVGSVFAVVFSTMLYSMRKIKNDNLIDALRNENL